jgi:hypothetical protein
MFTDPVRVEDAKKKTAKELQSGDVRSPNQDFLLMKLILQLFAIERPPVSVKLLGQDFKHHHLVAVNIFRASFQRPTAGERTNAVTPPNRSVSSSRT